MSKFTKKLDSYNIQVGVELVFGIYGKYFCSTAEQLAELVSEEFDANVTADEVERFFELPSSEEEDVRIIYNNIYS